MNIHDLINELPGIILCFLGITMFGLFLFACCATLGILPTAATLVASFFANRHFSN